MRVFVNPHRIYYYFINIEVNNKQTKHLWRFIKLRLNHWSHMAYFNDVFPIVLDLQCVNCVAES